MVVTLVNLFVQTKNKCCFHSLFNKWLSLFMLPLFCKLRLQLFSCSVTFNYLQPHGLQHTRPPCPSPAPEVCPSSCPLHQRCHPTTWPSVVLFLLPSIFPSRHLIICCLKWLTTYFPIYRISLLSLRLCKCHYCILVIL